MIFHCPMILHSAYSVHSRGWEYSGAFMYIYSTYIRQYIYINLYYATPMVSLEFFIDMVFPAALWPWN
jgi:hypothetical protein